MPRIGIGTPAARAEARPGYSIPMTLAAQVLGIDHIYLTVSSLERSEAFYDRVLEQTLLALCR